jgi:hypothetical protein
MEIKIMKTTAIADAILKYAAFPSIFLQLKSEDRDSISRSYDVGPDSVVKEISIDSVAKKPYSEGLIVYTTSVLSNKEQSKAQDELQSAVRDYSAKDEEYKRFKGSAHGDEMLEKKKEELKTAIDKKYTPKERPVAWGVGTNFKVNRELFHYHSGRIRGRGYSDAPSNRKDLIEYIKSNGGTAYTISQDTSVATTRQERSKNKTYSDPQVAVLEERAAKFGLEKKKELDVMIDKYIDIQKKNAVDSLQTQLDSITAKIKVGEAYSIPQITLPLNSKMLTALGEAYYKLKSGSRVPFYSSTFEDAKKSLMDYVKELNDLVAKIKSAVG